jgi:5-formyltetrahydrofolate cyclo-ligase
MSTEIDVTTVTRERIWRDLRRVARPDSRFHWDFSSFIPDFEGNPACTDRMLSLEAFEGLGERRIFVTPDNSTEDLRYRLLTAGRPFVITTYGIVRGFLEMDPSVVPAGDLRYAATLDGADRYGRTVNMADLKEGAAFGLLATGSAAVSANGVRFGKGHGYFDLEWAILSELGLTDEATIVAVMVHDCQVVDQPLPAKPHDVVVDWIVTPTRAFPVDHGGRAAGRLRWEDLQTGELSRLDVIAECRAIIDLDS